MALHSPSAGSIELARAGSLTTIAKLLGVTERTISNWRSGARQPTEQMQIRMAERLRIARELWRQAPPSAHPERDNDTHVADASEPSEAILDDASAIERLRAQVVRLEAARLAPGLSDRSRIELEKIELQASNALGKFEGRDVSEAQLLGSRFWLALQGKIVGALVRHPLALDSALAAITPDHPGLGVLRRNHPAEVAEVERAEAALLAAIAALAMRRAAG